MNSDPLYYHPRKFRRGNSGKQFKMRVIERALSLLRMRRIARKNGIPTITYQWIADQVGVFSRNTIARWDSRDMSKVAILIRKKRKSNRRKFSDEMESVLAGWVICRDLTQEPSTTNDFSEFAFNFFQTQVTPSFITNFMKRNHLSLKQVGNANCSELKGETIDVGVKFLEDLSSMIDRYNLRSENIIAFDKTYLMTSPWHKMIKHMSPTGKNKPRKKTCPRGAGNILSFSFPV